MSVAKHVKVKVLHISPKPGCTICHGRGYVSGGTAEVWGARVSMPSESCSCVEDQIPEDYDGEIVIDEPYAPGQDF